MSRTIFTAEDIKNIVRNLFNGNLEDVENSNNAIDYQNENSEQIVLKNLDTGETISEDLAKYLNIKFYSWKQRLVEKQNGLDSDLSMYDSWIKSLEYSMNESYALVELINDEVTPSQDIDNAIKEGKISFIIQTNKIANLDYYINKLRNKYMGVPVTMQNAFGDKIKAYLLIGTLNYDEEPTTLQFGECLLASCGFRIAYMADADTYSDNEVFFSFDGDDEYNEDGSIIGETKFLSVPLTKITWQTVFTGDSVPRQSRPDIVGFVASSASNTKTFSFYDFNKTLIKKINDIFWGKTAYRINGKLTTRQEINIPVFVKVVCGENSYIFEDVVTEIEKVITNSDFNITSISLRNWGKVTNKTI
jgi:hypothetical protein